MKLVAWREDGTPKRVQLLQEWRKLWSGEQPPTPKEIAFITCTIIIVGSVVAVGLKLGLS